MSKPVKSSQKSRNLPMDSATVARLALGVYLLVFMLCQLFAFEKFPGLLEQIGLGSVLSTVVAIALVIAELVAMPVLIGLKTGSVIERVSLVSSFVALALISWLEVMAYIGGMTMLFGATLDLPGGAWSLLLVFALWVLLLWSSGIFKRWDRPVSLSRSKPKA